MKFSRPVLKKSFSFLALAAVAFLLAGVLSGCDLAKNIGWPSGDSGNKEINDNSQADVNANDNANINSEENANQEANADNANLDDEIGNFDKSIDDVNEDDFNSNDLSNKAIGI